MPTFNMVSMSSLRLSFLFEYSCSDPIVSVYAGLGASGLFPWLNKLSTGVVYGMAISSVTFRVTKASSEWLSGI